MTTERDTFAATMRAVSLSLFIAVLSPTALAAQETDEHADHSEPDTHNGQSDDHGGADVVQLTDEKIALAGLQTAVAQPGTLRETLQVYGRIEPIPSRMAVVRARFSGQIIRLDPDVGQRVTRGDALATVEADDSLQRYTLRAPVSGVIVGRMATAGEATADRNLLRIADYSQVWAQLAIFPSQAEKVRAGQTVLLLGDGVQTEGVIDWITPDAMLGPARHARVVLPNPDGKWTPDSTIRAEIVTAVTDAALVVENRALQDIEGRPSVFVREADDFEVHPLTLGRSDGRATEVLGGLKPGVVYVTANSYLLKAELEKSSAEHDH